MSIAFIRRTNLENYSCCIIDFDVCVSEAASHRNMCSINLNLCAVYISTRFI